MVITFQQSMDQPGVVANPALGQLNNENVCFPFPRSRLRNVDTPSSPEGRAKSLREDD